MDKRCVTFTFTEWSGGGFLLYLHFMNINVFSEVKVVMNSNGNTIFYLSLLLSFCYCVYLTWKYTWEIQSQVNEYFCYDYIQGKNIENQLLLNNYGNMSLLIFKSSDFILLD